MATDRQEVLKNQLERLRAEKKSLRRKLAELKRERRDLQREVRDAVHLLENLPAGMVLVQEEKIIAANPAAWERFGYTREELLGKKFADFLHPDSAKEVKTLHRQRLTGKLVPNVYEAYMVTKQGERACCEIRVRKVRYRGKRAFLASIVDVGKRKEKDRALSQSIKREALIRLAAGIGQELKVWRGKLQRSIGDLQKIQKGSLPEDTQWVETVKEIGAVFAEGDRIIRDLDSLSGEDRGQNLNMGPFDLKKLVREAVAEARAAFEGKYPEKSASITLKTYLRATSPVHGNPEEMKQAIAAVVQNAMDSLPPDGQIYISIEEGAGFASIYVQDSGVSISENTIDRIFDPYFTTNGKEKRGLGLSLAQAVVGRHHGEIEVMSGLGRGATFTIKLPIARKSPEAEKRPRGSSLKDSRILILSEEGIVRDLLSQLFVSKGGKVRTAATDMEVFNLLKKTAFDLVIADPSGLPTDLPKAITRIKRMGRQMPVALVNASSQEDFGADLVVGKPLDVDRVLPLVSQVLASRGTAP